MKLIWFYTLAASIFLQGCGFTNEPDPGAMVGSSPGSTATSLMDAGVNWGQSEPTAENNERGFLSDGSTDEDLMTQEAGDEDCTDGGLDDLSTDGGMDEAADATTPCEDDSDADLPDVEPDAAELSP